MNKKFFSISRENMIKNQIITNQVNDPNIINAIAEIEREKFVSNEYNSLVYSDSNIPFKEGRYLMKTFIFAKMLQNCNIKKKDSVLVIGCLSGYSVAVISKLCSYVFGIENDINLTKKANNILTSLGYLNTSITSTNLIEGLKKNAPYDKILIQGGVEFIPKIISDQVTEGGQVFFMQKIEDGLVYEFTLGEKNNGLMSYRGIFTCNSFLLKEFKNNDKNEVF